jgi:hypothetical protein
MDQKIVTRHDAMFWFHLFITILSWAAMFLVSWQIMWVVFGTLLLQFAVFNDCLLNKKHGLDTGEDTTFYTYLLESVGIYFPRKPLRRFVRRYLYFCMAAFTWFWQVGLGFKALLF